MQSPLSITPAPMSLMKPYSNLDTIKRDASLEANLELAWREPSAAERGELEGLLRMAADFLQVPYEPPIARGLVLAGDLTAHQRAEIDRVYVPRYSAALEKDEAAREGFAFVECGERMADLRKGADERGLRVMWSSTPFNAACGEFAGKPRIFWSRQSVAELFWRACAAFNAIGFTPQVEDGYRPPAVQEGLFRRRVKMVRDENPQLGVVDVLREVAAKTATSPLRAAHMAGAAIDFTLREADGQPLDLGNPYPTGGAATILDFPYVTWAQYRTRSLFAEVSQMAGLNPYPGEDWHVSKGDGLAAIIEGITTVKYCALRDFDRATGAVQQYDPQLVRKTYSHEGLL